MAFKNEDDLRSFLMGKCRNAVMETQNNVCQDVINRANDFYSDYPKPKQYNRTWQLNNGNPQTEKFIQISPISSSNYECNASVYLEANNLEYVTGQQPSGEQVMAAALQGLHGAEGDIGNGKEFYSVPGRTGVTLWDESLQKKATDDLVRSLMVQGIPIKKT